MLFVDSDRVGNHCKF